VGTATLRREVARLRALVAQQAAAPATARSRQGAAEFARCVADPVHFINAHCRTYDPRTAAKSLPFKLFPKQVEFVRWLRALEAGQQSGLCEKSRGVGVSFLCAAYALHGWLFRPGYKAGFGSRKLEYVDKIGDMDSIFEKIRFMLRGLPPWMLPEGFRWRDHDCHTKLLNPANGAAITGEGGDQIGRGGRCSIYFVDEAAFIERPHLIDRSLAENTNVRVDVSTPNGPGNPFAVKRYSLPVERVFTLHWRDDPRKDEAWAERTKRERGVTAFAAEYDIDYSASLEGICIPGAWVRAAVGLDLPKSGKCVAGFDVGEEGNDLSVLIPRWGPVAGDPVSWGRQNTTATAWRARDEANRLGVQEVYFDADGVGSGVKGTWKAAENPLGFGDHPVHVGSSATETFWPDGQTSKERFANLKAELWWRLRCRFERSYEYVTQGVDHAPEDMISIVNHPQLIADLSLPLVEYTENGKIRLESKEKLRRRGVKSPDFAEALVLSEAAYAVKKQKLWLYHNGSFWK
jgi:hypothetical protein